MSRSIYLAILLISILFPVSNIETGWSYNQSTYQAFYLFESIEIEGELAEPGLGTTTGPGDVIGAFKDGI